MTDRRSDILAVAKEIFAERGVKATTVREIGNRAGILSGSLYHHFDSKLDIVDAILSEFCDEILEHYRQITAEHPDPVERVRALNRYAFSLITDHTSALTMFFNEGRHLVAEERFAYLVTFERKIEDYWVAALKDGIEQGAFRPDVDPRLFYRVMRDTIAGAVHWFRPSRARSIDKMADEFIDLMLRGLRPR